MSKTNYYDWILAAHAGNPAGIVLRGILPSLPWWIVWFPSLIIIGFIALAVVIMAIGAVLVTIFTIFGW